MIAGFMMVAGYGVEFSCIFKSISSYNNNNNNYNNVSNDRTIKLATEINMKLEVFNQRHRYIVGSFLQIFVRLCAKSRHHYHHQHHCFAIWQQEPPMLKLKLTLNQSPSSTSTRNQLQQQLLTQQQSEI